MEKENMYGGKIRSIRLLRGFSQEYMAEKLGIDQTKYSRIETGAQKLSVDMVQKIATVLDVSMTDITNNEPLIIQNIASNYGAQGRIENFYADQKELFEKQLASKDKEIDRLSKQIEQLMKMLERKK